MNSETLKRMFRAIASGSESELRLVAQSILERERDGGHPRLADELSAILVRGSRGERSGTRRLTQVPNVIELPTSRRTSESLASLTPPEVLEHHMVLPPEVEKRFQRIEQEYAARERLLAHGLAPRRTVLIHGPPGCGKTLAAKRLAWNTGLPLMKVRFDSLLSSYFGESAANLKSVFDAAAERPCVLLFDECDFIARSRRGSRDVGEASRIVSALLQLMEEYEGPGLLVATTNVDDALDEALFRRFDDVFLVPLPGPVEIEALLRITLSAMQVGKVKWATLVDRLKGMPAAQVVRAARDASKDAVLSGRERVEQADLERAIASRSSARPRRRARSTIPVA